MSNNFYDIFSGEKPLIGMLHLAGEGTNEILRRALMEARTYKEGGFGGMIVEDFHGSAENIPIVLSALMEEKLGIPIGVNVLSNPYSAFELANRYSAQFVQFDTIQTSRTDTLNPRKFNEQLFTSLRKQFPEIIVLGGVRFKYIPPTGRSLEEDIVEGKQRCDAIVTTGRGTGIETPTEKLKDFRRIMGDFPLVVGSGVKRYNITEQMEIVDGAVIGSYVKGGPEHTEDPVQIGLVRELVSLA